MKNNLYKLFILIFFFNCSADNDPVYLSKYSGRIGDVILVKPNGKKTFNKEINNTINVAISPSIYGLPQQEPLFNLIKTDKKGIKSIFKTFRNIIILEIDKQNKNTFEVEKNKWAKGQIIIKIRGNNNAEILENILKNKKSIQYIFNKKEIDRLVNRNKKFGEKLLSKKIEKNLFLYLVTQKGFKVVSIDSSHVWIALNSHKIKGGLRHQVLQGVLICSIKYVKKQQFLSANILKYHNYFLGKYIKNIKSKKMVLENKYIIPKLKEINFNNQYSKEMHGLWKTTGYIMGGPMYSITTIDEKNNRIIMAIGYVFAPGLNKREFLRETEAIIKSITFIKK